MQAAPDNSRKHEVGAPVTVANGSTVSGRVDANQKELARQRVQILQLDLLSRRQGAVLGMLAGFMDASSLQPGLMDLVNTIQSRFQCTRVALALYDNNDLAVKAVSQHSTVEPGSTEFKRMLEPMREAIGADKLLHFTGKDHELMPPSFESWLQGRERMQICALPLVDEQSCVGALLLEAEGRARWSKGSLELLQQLALSVTPLIQLRRAAEMGLRQHARTRVKCWVEQLSAPRHFVPKLVTGLSVLLLLPLALIPFPHALKADAELIASERRVISAPRVGYVDEVRVSVGARVTAGQSLLHLDSRELELEQERWQNEIRALDNEKRAAMAAADRSEMALLNAQQEQMQAELQLVEERLARSDIRAPVDGIVVSGDLTQVLGAPVERGRVLLELAPDDDFSVHLLIDEADIQRVSEGQAGQLSLAADPGREIPFTVATIHPMAEPGAGSNRFRVEAVLTEERTGMRPGQTGVAQLEVGKASLLWQWTYRFSRWLRQSVWRLGL